MIINFNGNKISEEIMQLTGWKFHQPKCYSERGDCLFPYDITLKREHFFSLIGALYNEIIEEYRIDVAQYNDFDPPYEGATDYPTLSDFIKIDSIALADFISWINELVMALFWDGLGLKTKSDSICSIVTLDDIIELDDEIILKGLAVDISIWNEIRGFNK